MSGCKFEGMDKLYLKLEKCKDTAPITRIVQYHTQYVQGTAQRIVPVDTGSLKRSIGISIEDGGMTGRVKPTMEYAAYVEYGTRFMEAQPYMRPAFNQQKDRFINDIKKVMK